MDTTKPVIPKSWYDTKQQVREIYGKLLSNSGVNETHKKFLDDQSLVIAIQRNTVKPNMFNFTVEHEGKIAVFSTYETLYEHLWNKQIEPVLKEWFDNNVTVLHKFDENSKRMWFRVITDDYSAEFTINEKQYEAYKIKELLSGVFSDDELDYIDDQVRSVMHQYITPKHSKNSASELAGDLPGINNRVKNPEEGTEDSLYSVIINLNDTHKWTRERIADWIESLDEVPVFETLVEDEDEKELPEAPKVVALKRIL